MHAKYKAPIFWWLTVRLTIQFSVQTRAILREKEVLKIMSRFWVFRVLSTFIIPSPQRCSYVCCNRLLRRSCLSLVAEAEHSLVLTQAFHLAAQPSSDYTLCFTTRHYRKTWSTKAPAFLSFPTSWWIVSGYGTFSNEIHHPLCPAYHCFTTNCVWWYWLKTDHKIIFLSSVFLSFRRNDTHK